MLQPSSYYELSASKYLDKLTILYPAVMLIVILRLYQRGI